RTRPVMSTKIMTNTTPNTKGRSEVMSRKRKKLGEKNMNEIKMGRPVLALSLAVVPAFLGCAAETVDGVEAVETKNQALLPAECEELGETINSHTCQHGDMGPFASVSASSDPAFSGSTPSFSGIHTYFTVTLPGSGSPRQGTVKFTPAKDDSHVVYFHPSVTVTVKDKDGNPLAPELTGTVNGCEYLTGYSIFDLKKSTSTHAPYWISFTASTSPINVALEEVSPMAEWWWYDGDGDGYGPSFANRLKTACVP